MILRPYTPQDKAACLALFDSNIDPYFMPQERPAFIEFLDGQTGSDYFVVEQEDGQPGGAIVGCGGIAFIPESGQGILTWGMIDRTRHRQGIGQFLTTERINRLRQIAGLKSVTIKTSQHTAAFYARFGFETEEIIEDGFGPSLHNYRMKLDINR